MNFFKTMILVNLTLSLTVNFRRVAIANPTESSPNFSPTSSPDFREPLRFQLPDRGAPGNRTADAGGRGNCKKGNQLTAIVPPENWGYTLSERPTFWFYFASQDSSSFDAEFELLDQQKQTLVQFPLTIKPGLISVELPPDLSLLQTETQYIWNFLIICDRSDRTLDLVVRGEVIKRELDQHLKQQIQQQQGRNLALIYAQNGLWFDSLNILAQFQAKQPENPVYFEDWKTLLNQIGLENLTSEF